MFTSRILRTSLVVAALGAALSAQAVTIFLVSHGTGALDVNNNFVQNEKVLVQTGGFGALTSLVQTSDNTNFPNGSTGEYSGAGGTLDYSYVISDVTSNGAFQSVDGAWTYTGGTGTYANLPGGGGTLAFTIDLSSGEPDETGTVFSGDLQAVPEPASMAVLGVGALGLLRRRKKA